MVTPALANDPTALGTATAESLRAWTTDGFQENIATPMTAESPMVTPDGLTTFTTQLTAPSSTAFLSILLQPSATGDLSLLQVRQDIDFDGTYDHTYTAVAPVSGICANGLLQCTPGTWDNCKPHAWQTKNDRLTLSTAFLTDLAGCYCINDSCGSSLPWQNLPVLLKDIGGGAVAAIQAAHPSYVITEVAINGPEITYYGQHTGAGRYDLGGQPLSGEATQTAYYDNPAGLPDAGLQESITQSATPDSYFSTLTTTMNNLGAQRTAHVCTVERVVSLDEIGLNDIMFSQGGPYGSWTPTVDPATGEKFVRWVIGRKNADGWMPSNSIVDQPWDLTIQRPDHITRATLTKIRADDTTLLMFNGVPAFGQPAMCQPDGTGCDRLAGNNDSTPNFDVTPHLRVQGNVQANARVFVGPTPISVLIPTHGGGEGFAIIKIVYEEDCGTSEAIHDNCSSYTLNPDCSLQEEIVDGVTTIRDFSPTMLTPLPTTRTFTGNNCTYDLTADWWVKQRQYVCASQNTFDFSNLDRRVSTVVGSADSNDRSSGSFAYSDDSLDEAGTWTTESHTLDGPPLPPSGDCHPICKTRLVSPNTDANLSGPATTQRVDPDVQEVRYHECRSDGTCPAGPGETIVKDCQCITEFAEAATILISLEDATRDLICSDGQRK